MNAPAKQVIKNIIMKKRLLSNFKVKRISTSPYFKESFAQLEKSTIEKKADAIVLPLNSPESAEVLISNTHTVTSKISPSDKTHCRLMIHPNSGYDNLEASFVSSVTFPIVIGNPIRAQAVANFILSALFSHYSKIPTEKNWDEKRSWKRKLLSELKILILGKGHIGSLLEKSLSPLAKSVHIYDPYKGSELFESKNIDVVIPACSLNTKNWGMINRDFLLNLNSDFLLINAARGQLVVTEDLISVLKMRPHAFAYLDVFENEPADFSLFNDVPNVHLTSHTAGVYSSIDEATAEYVATVIDDFQTMDQSLFHEKYKSVLLSSRLQNGMLI